MRLSIVTPHSANAGRQAGNRLGDGGGESLPVNPHNPSCAIRGAREGGKSVGVMGSRVQMRLCSISGGTAIK